MTGYLGVVVYLVLVAAFGVVSLAAARLLRPSRPFASKSDTYECGAEPVGDAWVQFPVGFYLVALVFILFDALSVFLFPWALVMRSLGGAGFAVMLGFLATVSLGWWYARREGIFEWQ